MTLAKKLLLTILAITGHVALMSFAQANAVADDASREFAGADIPDYVGMVLGDPRYADVLKDLNAKLPSESYLVIRRHSSLALQGTTYIYLDVERHLRSSPQSTKVIGQIVGEVRQAPGRGELVRAVYFKPAAELPGGVSVGNQ